jgi:hypothetical protein
MALSTFSELKTEIADYLDRSDLTSQIPTFIRLAEARMNRGLRIRLMETVKVITAIPDIKRYPLPSDYLQLRTIQYDTSKVASSTLSADVTDIVAIMPLVSTTGFTASGTILIGSEQITYAAIAGNTLTGCGRGANGSTPAAHNLGDAVTEVYTVFTAGTISSDVSSRVKPLSYVTPEILSRLKAGSYTGQPEMYTMRAGYLLLGPAPADLYTIEIDYFAKIPALSDAAPTNSMLTDNPDVYLYGALLEASPFLMMDASTWAAAFRQAVQDIQLQDDKDSHSGNEMRVMNTSGYY